jgi:hypothetical protein
MRMMKKLLIAGTVLAATAVAANATETHWWQLVHSSRGVHEVCTDKRKYDNGPTTPARSYQVVREGWPGGDARIEEETSYGIPVVKIIWWHDASEWELDFFRTLEDCQTVAKKNSLAAGGAPSLDPYR